MAANTFRQASGSIQTQVWRGSSSRHNRLGTFSVRMSSRSLATRTEIYGARKVSSIRASTTHSLADTLQLPSISKSSDISTKPNETVLTLLRHGESMWNEKNLYTGCVDVALTEKGVEEAIEAGKRTSNIPVDEIYTSSLIRAQMTAVIAMTQHRCKKVPIILHDESEQAKTWSEIHSEEARKQSISVITAWQLNERMYGDLQGFNKQEIAEKLGNELVHAWCRTYHSPPPNGESLEMCGRRAVAYFREHVIDLEMLTGIPMLYIFEDGKFVRRGSPIGPRLVFMLTPRCWISTGRSWMRCQIDRIIGATSL